MDISGDGVNDILSGCYSQSNVTQADRLQGKLLLLVGELDWNVDPA